MFSYLLLAILLPFSYWGSKQPQTMQKEREYNITKMMQLSRNSQELTKILDLEKGNYLATRHQKGRQEYQIFDSQHRMIAKEISKDKTNTPVVMSIGFCTITIFKSMGGPKVTVGNGKVTAKVKCS